jgi:hypothetical protein
MRPDLECLYRITAALLIGALSSANAQTPVVRLGPPSATLTEDFSEIVAVRELSDGRLLIGDRREERIVVADFRAGSVTPTSRQGLDTLTSTNHVGFRCVADLPAPSAK